MIHAIQLTELRILAIDSCTLQKNCYNKNEPRQFWEEYGVKPVSEVSGLTHNYPGNTLRLGWFL